MNAFARQVIIAAVGATAALASAACTGATQGDDTAPDAPSAAVLSPNSVTVVEDEEEFNLVAQVGLPGRVIKFFEPSPGNLLQIEKGLGGQARPAAEESRLSGSALYTFLTGDAAPDLLIEAEKRARTGESAKDGTFDTVGGTSAPTDNGLPSLSTQGYTQAARIDTTEFYRTYCEKTDRFWTAIRATEDSWAEGTGINFMRAGAYVQIGSIEYQGYWGGKSFYARLEEGWYTGWSYSSRENHKARSAVYPYEWTIYDHCINYHF